MIHPLPEALRRVGVFDDTHDIAAALTSMAATMPAGDAYYLNEAAEHMIGQHELIRSLAHHLKHRDVKTPIAGLGLTVRAENCLLAAGFKFIEDAQALGISGIKGLSNVGHITATEIMSWKPHETSAQT